ncbi:MAG: NAD(P)H-dependent oxidoreductase subunit E [Chloroflexota bacterium]
MSEHEATADHAIDPAEVGKMVEEHRWRRGAALTVLEAVQHRYGWVSYEAIVHISRLTDWSPSYLYGIVTYYDEFRITPPGVIAVAICNGSACALNREDKILEALEDALGIKELADASPDELFTQNKFGYVTDDGKVVLRKADCIGCCQLAPVVRVGTETMVGLLTPDTTRERVQAALVEAGVGMPSSSRGTRAPGDQFRVGNLR